jgi:hypothetical protein
MTQRKYARKNGPPTTTMETWRGNKGQQGVAHGGVRHAKKDGVVVPNNNNNNKNMVVLIRESTGNGANF